MRKDSRRVKKLTKRKLKTMTYLHRLLDLLSTVLGHGKKQGGFELCQAQIAQIQVGLALAVANLLIGFVKAII